MQALRAAALSLAGLAFAACSQDETLSGTTHVRIRFDERYSGQEVSLAVDGVEIYSGVLTTDPAIGSTGEEFDYEMRLGNRRLTLAVDGVPIETEALRHDAKPYLYVDYDADVEDFALVYTAEERHAE